MSRRFTLFFLLLVVETGVGFSTERTPEGRAVDAALTAFHAAAAEADGELYFSLLAEDMIYIGTEISHLTDTIAI